MAHPDKLEVLLSTEDGKTPPPNAIKVEIIQTDDEGHFLVALLPPQVTPGIYYLWVRKSCGL